MQAEGWQARNKTERSPSAAVRAASVRTAAHHQPENPRTNRRKIRKQKHHSDYSRVVFKLLSEVPLAKGTVFHHERIRCLRGAGSLATVSDSAVCRFRKAPRLKALNLLVCAHRLCN